MSINVKLLLSLISSFFLLAYVALLSLAGAESIGIKESIIFSILPLYSLASSCYFTGYYKAKKDAKS